MSYYIYTKLPVFRISYCNCMYTQSCTYTYLLNIIICIDIHVRFVSEGNVIGEFNFLEVVTFSSPQFSSFWTLLHHYLCEIYNKLNKKFCNKTLMGQLFSSVMTRALNYQIPYHKYHRKSESRKWSGSLIQFQQWFFANNPEAESVLALGSAVPNAPFSWLFIEVFFWVPGNQH